MNYRTHCNCTQSALQTEQCLFHTTLLQSTEGQQNRKQSLVKLHINMKYFTNMRNLATTIIIRNTFQTSKKEALSVHRNQKDLLSLVSAYKVVYPHTQYCLMKPYTENSAELKHLMLEIYNGKYTSEGKSTNAIKCSLFCSRDVVPQLMKFFFLFFGHKNLFNFSLISH